MDTVLRKQTISNFIVPPEDANSKFLWNTATQTTCYPNLHHNMFIHQCEKWSKKPSRWFMQEKLNYKYTLCSEPTLHDVMLLHFAPHLSYSFHRFVKWNNKAKGYNKTKSCKPFWNAKCYQFYIYRRIYSQHNYPKYMELPKQKWNKYHNSIYHWTWQILTATVFQSTLDVHKCTGEQTIFWILRSTEIILH